MANPLGLLTITSVRVPVSALAAVLLHLRDAGADGYEGLALLAGRVSGNTADVCETIIPRQHAMRTPSGLCVTVDAEELYQINVHLYERQLRLLVQVHSHGEAAYHSAADDSYSIVTTLGALSIVVPYFSEQPFALHDCAVYRLQKEGWRHLSRMQAQALIKLTD